MGAVQNSDGTYSYPTKPSSSPSSSPASSPAEHATASATDFATPPQPPRRQHNVKVVLIGDSAGGNLVLGVARWIRDEGVLPPPDGLLLLSPSCDPSHAFPLTPSSYVPRPNADTDYLVDTPEPRALLQRTFLGHHPLETIHSPYLSPASPRVLRTYGHPTDPLPGSMGRVRAGARGTADGALIGAGAVAIAAESAIALAGPTVVANAEAGMGMAAVAGVGTHDSSAGHIPQVQVQNQDGPVPVRSSLDSVTGTSTIGGTPRLASASTPRLASAGLKPPAAGPRRTTDLDLSARAVAAAAISHGHGQAARGNIGASRPLLQSTLTFLNPSPRDPGLRASLFGRFPRTFVLVGDAERLEKEVSYTLLSDFCCVFFCSILMGNIGQDARRSNGTRRRRPDGRVGQGCCSRCAHVGVVGRKGARAGVVRNREMGGEPVGGIDAYAMDALQSILIQTTTSMTVYISPISDSVMYHVVLC
jgi:hypothetical protein